MTRQTLEYNQRLRGGLYGLLVGDALGVPYEFHDASAIPAEHLIEMEPPKRFRRAHSGVPIGTWSDDGAQALCLLESLNQNQALDLSHFARLLVAWYENGYMTPDGHVFDVGIQTSRAIHTLLGGANAADAGPAGERDNGNGGLMRCLPVVFAAKSVDGVIDLAMKQGLVSHGHARSQLCCAVYAAVSLGILDGLSAGEAVAKARVTMDERFSGTSMAREQQVVLRASIEDSRGSGYVVDSLWSAIDCVLNTDNYESCVRRAIMLGNDTDTTACIAGGLAGLLYGLDAIPSRWVQILKGKDLVEKLLRAAL